jgi:hypothetical protein
MNESRMIDRQNDSSFLSFSPHLEQRKEVLVLEAIVTK